MTDIDKKTLVLGASENPARYSNLAIKSLRRKGFTVVAIGNRIGQVIDIPIHTEKIVFEDINTITLYLSAKNQIEYYDYILKLNPKRVIFNPGAENEELEKLLQSQDIIAENACTLVLLNLNHY
jgi:hypothetical protein